MGTPLSKVAQATEIKGDASDKGVSPFSLPEGREHILCSPEGESAGNAAPIDAVGETKKSSGQGLFLDGSSQTEGVKLRSSPVQILEFSYPSGKPGYLVVGTVVPKQKRWREKFAKFPDAEARRAEWEEIRVRMAAGMQLRATSLSNEAIRDAENASAVAKKLGFSSLLDAVLAAGKPGEPEKPEGALPKKTYQELFDAFVAYHKEHASKSQTDKVRQDSKRFGDYVGWSTDIASIKTSHFVKWLGKPSTTAEKKTFNNVLNNVSRVFSWACEPAQKYLKENPAAPIDRYSNRVLGQGARMIMTPERCAELMLYVEQHHPEWVFPFALMLFAGVRPGYYEGEIRKLMSGANRDGIETYTSNGVLHITAEIAKDRRPRQLHMPANLIAWVERYTPKQGTFALGSSETYAQIREKFRVPHDGLRHTAISAHITLNGAFADAAVEFGNSETIIRRHYYSRMTKAQAEAFYAIMPQL